MTRVGYTRYFFHPSGNGASKASILWVYLQVPQKSGTLPVENPEIPRSCLGALFLLKTMLTLFKVWGGNCRSRSDRIEKLGWKPQGTRFLESLPAMIAEEAKTLGTQSSKTTFDK